MPRKPIEVPFKLEYLSILDENGEVDKSLEPKLDAAALKKMYRYMLMARLRTDERLLNWHKNARGSYRNVPLNLQDTKRSASVRYSPSKIAIGWFLLIVNCRIPL